MHIFSDFTLFERPPKPGVGLLRWLAWRWLLGGILFTTLVLVVALVHYFGGEPVYYVNEGRNLSNEEAINLLTFFLSAGGVFLFLGLAGVLFIPKA